MGVILTDQLTGMILQLQYFTHLQNLSKKCWPGNSLCPFGDGEFTWRFQRIGDLQRLGIKLGWITWDSSFGVDFGLAQLPETVRWWRWNVTNIIIYLRFYTMLEVFVLHLKSWDTSGGRVSMLQKQHTCCFTLRKPRENPTDQGPNLFPTSLARSTQNLGPTRWWKNSRGVGS